MTGEHIHLLLNSCTIYVDNWLVCVVFFNLPPISFLILPVSVPTDYMSWLHAAGTPITHRHPLHGTAAKEREGKGGVVAHGVGGDGEHDKAMTKDNMEIERQGRTLAKSWWKDEGRWGSKMGERACDTPFWTPRRENAVASRHLRGAAEMQFFLRSLFTQMDKDKSFFSVSLIPTHPHACSFHSSPFPYLQFNNAKKKKKKAEQM